MKYFFTILFFLIGQTSSAQVTVVEDSVFSPNVRATMKFYSILPDGYRDTNERYACIFLLHGLYGNYTNWITLTKLVHYANDYKFIIITPDARDSWYVNSPTMPNANYEDYIMHDLLPYVDTHYRTKQSKESRSVVGLSMGAYGAAKFGIKYPSYFSFVGCLSPAIQFPSGLEDSIIVSRRSKEYIDKIKMIFGFPRNIQWDENDVSLLLERSRSDSLPYFYLVVGSSDLLYEYINRTYTFVALLRKQGVPFEMHEVPGTHNWQFWDREIKNVLHRINELSENNQ